MSRRQFTSPLPGRIAGCLGAAAGALGLLTACGGAQALKQALSPPPANEASSSALEALSRLPRERRAPASSVAVGVTGRGLTGRRLPDGPRWDFEAEVNVLPSLDAELVAFTTAEQLIVLKAESGEQLFQLPAQDRRLEGFGQDGDYLMFLMVDKDDARPDLMLVVDQHGNVRHRETSLEKLGTPAVWQGYGFIPVGERCVSLVELDSGRNLGQLALQSGANGVMAGPGYLTITGQGLSVLRPGEPRQNSSRLELKLGELPGPVSWPENGTKPRPARGRPKQVLIQPGLDTTSGALAPSAYAYVYYELLAAYQAGSGRLLWVQALPKTALFAAAGQQSLSVCMEDGQLLSFDWQTGRPNPAGSLETRLKACVLSSPMNLGAGMNLGSGTDPQTPAQTELETQVASALAQTGPDLEAYQLQLLSALAELPGDRVTSTLLKLARDPLSSRGIAVKTGELLAQRREGKELMIAALEDSAPRSLKARPELRKLAVLQPTQALLRPPPVGSLAQSLQLQQAREGAPSLAAHLEMAAAHPEEALAILRFLLELGSAEQLERVTEFFASNKNVGGEADFLAMLTESARFLLQFGGPREQALLCDAALDPVTYEQLKPAVLALLQAKKPGFCVSGSHG